MTNIKIKKCPHCNSEIDASAKKCPKCTADLRNWFTRRPVRSIFGSIILFIVAIILFGGNGQEKIKIEQTAIKISAEQLYAEYDANEVAADAKYKNKLVEVSGVIDIIGKDILDNPFITIKVGGQFSFSSIQCAFPKSTEQELAKLSKGHNTILRGSVSGKTIGSIMLRNCELIK